MLLKFEFYRAVLRVMCGAPVRCAGVRMSVRVWSLAAGPLPTTELIKEGGNLLPRPARSLSTLSSWGAQPPPDSTYKTKNTFLCIAQPVKGPSDKVIR